MDYNVDTLIAGIFGGTMIILLLIILPLIIVSIIALWKLFKKAGKKGWYSIIPIYSSWVLVEIAGLNWWWFLLMILNVTLSFDIEELSFAINICGFLATFNCYYNIAKKFNKDNTFAVFAGIFNFIFVLILGLSKNEVYDGNIPVSPNGIFGKPDINNNNNYNYSTNNTYNHTNNDNMYSQNNRPVVNQQMGDNNFVVNEQTNNNESVSFCGNCGTKLNSNAKFCPNCGKEKR